MTPAIITNNGKVEIVIGAAGGTKIPTAVTMAIMRYLWFGSTIKEAIDEPRFHHQLVPNEVQYEYGNIEVLAREYENRTELITHLFSYFTVPSKRLRIERSQN
jgi:gamma-glutamyltranspeptidase / glutathione hydrolase / leukotriene-C4 hydrolase